MRNRILFILLVVVLAISVGLASCEPAEPEPLEFMIFEVEPVTVLPEHVQNLASTLFALNITPRPPVNETAEFFWFQLDTLYVECCKDSGSIWFADFSKLYNEEYIPEELPSEEDAKAIAEEFLGSLMEQGLIPEREIGFRFIYETQTANFDIGTNEMETAINHLDVLYGFVQESIQYPGTNFTMCQEGAKIRVSIGDKGEIIGLHCVWRDLANYEFYPAITEEEALEIFREELRAEPEELEVRLEYYFESEFTKQGFVQPYYIFDGTVMIGEEEVPFKTKLIPATTFSPTARIESPDNGANLSEGEIDFEASVSGGEPPYKYIWESNIDGVIGTGASFSSNLSVGQRDEEILPHTIKLKVTDQNGNQDIDLISVKIIPTQSTSVLAMGSVPEASKNLSTGSPADDIMSDKEVGIEWVNDYDPYFLTPLDSSDKNAGGFKEELYADEWVVNFDFGDWYAWEEDFKFRGGLDGGTDFMHIDAVDFAYFSGHGGYDGICFRNLADYRCLSFEDARWGGDAGGNPGEEGDLEWIVLDACSTLLWYHPYRMDYVFDRWDQAFDGLHYVLGFSSTTGGGADRGRIFAQYMKQGWPVRLAWIRATQATNHPWVWGAYLRAESLDPLTNTYDDHLPGHGYVSLDPYPVDELWYLTWPCG